MSKLLEKMVASQLTAHLSSNNFLDELQFSFRPKHVSYLALTKVTYLLIVMDSYFSSILLLLDLQ